MRRTKPYAYAPSLESKPTSYLGYGYGFTGPNPNLRPEFAESYETGFELGFLQNRLGLDATFYRKDTRDQIVNNVRASYGSGYILINRIAGTRLPGVQAPALASTISAILYMPVLMMLLAQGRLTGMPLVYAVVAGVLSSAVPFAIDLTVLRSVPPRLFGVLMSVHPGLAALAGLVLLGQVPAVHEWIGMAMIVLANVAAVTMADRTPVDEPVPVLEPVA